MAIIGKRTIFVGPADDANHKPLLIEGKALAATTPGTVVEEVATGLQANANAATVFGQELLVANKDWIKSKTVDDDWTINENMEAVKLRSGEFANVLVITGQALVRGTPLALNGAGLLKIAVTPAVVGATSEQVLCYSDETVTTTATQLVSVRVA
jgi:hypothetical protein